MAANAKENSAAAHKWQFAPRFRRNAFGWKSDTPIQRIKEALSEIKQVARKEPVLAAEGAIALLEKLSPALEAVDSSSGVSAIIMFDGLICKIGDGRRDMC